MFESVTMDRLESSDVHSRLDAAQAAPFSLPGPLSGQPFRIPNLVVRGSSAGTASSKASQPSSRRVAEKGDPSDASTPLTARPGSAHTFARYRSDQFAVSAMSQAPLTPSLRSLSPAPSDVTVRSGPASATIRLNALPASSRTDAQRSSSALSRSARAFTSAHGRARPSTAQSAGRPNTAASELGVPPSSWICAILENRGVGREVGIAAMEKDTGQVIVTQFADTQTYVRTVHHLMLHPPATVLVPDTCASSADYPDPGSNGTAIESSILVCTIEDTFDMGILPFARKFWNHEDGAKVLDKVLVDDVLTESMSRERESSNSVDSSAHAGTELLAGATSRVAILKAIGDRYYALGACGALLKYVERSSNYALIHRSLRVRYSPPDGTMLIDTESARNLELVCNGVDRKSTDCLLGVLDCTRTPMARRLLVMNLLAPLTDQSTIQSRLDTVAELIEDEDRHEALQSSFKAFAQTNIDLDKLIRQLLEPGGKHSIGDPSHTFSKVGQVLELSALLRQVTSLRTALKGARSGLLRAIESFLSNPMVDEIVDKIQSCINPDLMVSSSKHNLANRNTRLFAVKASRSPLLDIARDTYRENIGDIHGLLNRYVEEYKLDIELACNDSSYSLRLATTPGMTSRDLPHTFTNVVRSHNNKSFSFTTLTLKKLNQRVIDSSNEILLMSTGIIEELRADVVQRVGALYKVSEALALLDMIHSFAICARSARFTRPEFTGTIHIKAGRHPVLEKSMRNKIVVPQDLLVSGGENFFIITGPNHSGKTTYLRQTALLHVMACVGSFVPAVYASFRLHTDSILTRLSNNDDQETNLSTFASELRSTAYILSLASKDSLVLIDELGRGTSPHGGFGVAQAVAEELIAMAAPTLFATHFTDLGRTLGHHPNVVFHRFSSSHAQQRLNVVSTASTDTIHHLERGILPK
ncbi:hypothetical protein IE81DRAFT_309693 [Ceraceosorus guamensis]|uniref:DNA mismatch repair proteins mutS family domain-containing protein n=1 Tax=Ceraceosorus guamensis TaxID=1522189 RepID=A0A316W551_9BASI|nr:hypothetical protein IE81DRAFT_309693 [Ceraceosorus guamensis]PWN45007.1 hypothetical protein IE81DRAFT_309693 [Ceraceosorus guamensis]